LFSSDSSVCSRNSSLRASTITVEEGFDRVVTTGHLRDPDEFIVGDTRAPLSCRTISLKVGRDVASNYKIFLKISHVSLL